MLVDDTGVLLAAIAFAAQKHRDQRRKDAARTPYINHPIRVAEILWTIGGVRDLATLVAAVLHDTVEDTNTRPEEIEARFGREVRDLVLEVTDDKSLPKAKRKELQVERAPHKSTKAKHVKLADKISNVADITDSPPPDWSHERRVEYLEWTSRVIAGLRGTSAALEAAYDAELERGRAALAAAEKS